MKQKYFSLITVALAKQKILEFIRFDSITAAVLLFLLYYMIILFNRIKGSDRQTLSFAGKIFRHINLAWARKYATNIFLENIRKRSADRVAEDCRTLSNISNNTVQRLKSSILDTGRPFDERLIILSPPKGDKKGVILIKFTHYFPYLPSVFNMEQLGKDYALVLEPSGAGYFDECLLCLMAEKTVILIQASEPVDQEFLNNIHSNLIVVDLGANCWVDPRKFYLIDGTNKEYDIVMVSIWASFKRHYHLFQALSMSQSRNKRKIALIGKPYPWSIHLIKQMARHYGVDKQIDYFEDIAQDQVNIILNKSKTHLLLSKKEGFNKATIEAMYADVPSFLIEGHNFGYKYPFLNKKTGGFIKDSGLSRFIDGIDDMLSDNKFSPREWISQNLSPQLSTKKLVEALATVEKERGVFINKDLKIKVNNPNCDYYDPNTWVEFAVHYKNLAKYLKG